MRTTEDLRAAFIDIADAVPAHAADGGDQCTRVVVPARRLAAFPKLRSAVLVVPAVAVVTATAALVPLFDHLRHAATPALSHPSVGHGRPTSGATTTPELVTGPPLGTALVRPAPGRPNLTIGFRVAPIAGFHTPDVDQVTTRYQAAEVDQIDDWRQGNATGVIQGPSGTVYVFYRGKFDATAAERGTPVSVHGKPGYFATIPYLDDGATGNVESLIWRYAADAWAVVQLEDPSGAHGARAAEHSVADAVLEAHSGLKVPFTLGHLPTGLVVNSLTATTPGNGISVEQGTRISHVDDTGATVLLDGPRPASPSGGDALYHGVEMTYLVDPTARSGRPCGPSMTTSTVDGVRLCLHTSATGIDGITAWFTHASLNLDLASNYVGIYTDAQLEHLVTRAHYATDPLDATTWFDAATPGR